MYGTFGVRYFCALFGKSRQAYYEQINNLDNQGFRDALVLRLVAEIRKDLPRCGTDKLHFLLQDAFKEHGIKMGRDALYRLLDRHGKLIRHRRRKPYTTDSNHPYRKYPNLIRDLELSAPGQLWVSDITYIRLCHGFAYLSIITDAYSHKIVGYKLHPTLHSQGAIDALLMAQKDVKRQPGLIHHSDRGVQYCCTDYVTMIEHLDIQLSMTEKGDPYENAIAERINGILKIEFLLEQTFSGLTEAEQAVAIAVKNYNHLRPHLSCDMMTPVMAHERHGLLKKHWKNKVFSLPSQCTS
ncbi:MAG TPA: IS3 family transposase [Niabella sp.]|nr:IS3 family transposase [Niabella sp.]